MNILPTKSNLPLLSSKDSQLCIKQRLLAQLNDFRKNPASIIPYLSSRKKNYSLQPPHLTLFSPFHPNKGLTTSQGPSPINELIGALYSLDRSLHLIQNPFLSLIASQIAQSFQSTKSLENIKLTESMGHSLRQELNRCEQFDFVDKITCLIGVGFDKGEQESLMGLLVDDEDNKNRKNRHLLMYEGKNWRFVGIGTRVLQENSHLRVTVYLFTSNVLKK